MEISAYFGADLGPIQAKPVYMVGTHHHMSSCAFQLAVKLGFPQKLGSGGFPSVGRNHQGITLIKKNYKKVLYSFEIFESLYTF